MDYALDAAETVAARGDGDIVSTRRLHEASRFSQRLLEFGPGRSRPRVEDEADETLYVVEGDATLRLAGVEHPVGPGTAAYVPRGAAWTLATAGGVVLLSVLVHEPLDASGAPAVVDLTETNAQSATAGRQFALGVGGDSATQFVGFIPVGRAPDHFHTYDEVVYVLQGEGALHIGGESARLRPGSCVHLPARLVHCLENIGPGEMHVLGVFRPAGSPAEAYYPDGTRAQY